MATCRSCSWCHAMNDITAAIATGQKVLCGECGHRADVCRLECDCPECTRAAPHVRVSEEDVADVLAKLRGG